MVSYRCWANEQHWTGLTSFGYCQARAKLRANDARLTFAWPSADLRLIS